jgi:hypothetical protein
VFSGCAGVSGGRADRRGRGSVRRPPSPPA